MSVEIAAQNITKLKGEVSEWKRGYAVIDRIRVEQGMLIETLREEVKKLEWLMDKTGWDRYRIWQEMLKEERQ